MGSDAIKNKDGKFNNINVGKIDYNTYDEVCWSYPWNRKELNYPVCLFNHEFMPAMKIENWTKKYRLYG